MGVKKHKGFSYIEVLIALALFSILTVTVLPSVLQSARNSVLALDYYNHHLGAQSIMLAVRDALVTGKDSVSVATETARVQNIELYTVLIFRDSMTSFGSYDAPDVAAALVSNLVPSGVGSTFVVVIVWNAEGVSTARAVGAINTRIQV